MSSVRESARKHALRVLQRQRRAAGDQLSDEEAMAIALEVQREARRQLNRQKARPGQSRK
jgi:hypothetical protein